MACVWVGLHGLVTENAITFVRGGSLLNLYMCIYEFTISFTCLCVRESFVCVNVHLSVGIPVCDPACGHITASHCILGTELVRRDKRVFTDNIKSLFPRVSCLRSMMCFPGNKTEGQWEVSLVVVSRSDWPVENSLSNGLALLSSCELMSCPFILCEVE